MAEKTGVGAVVSVLFICAVVLVLIFGSWTIISPGTRGIVIRLGSVNRVLDEGLHFKMPLIESVKDVDVRILKVEVQASAASKDLQTVSAKIALNFQLEASKVDELYKQVALDYEDRLLSPALQESIKAATAKYTAEELITKREQVKTDMKLNLAERLSKNFIQVVEVNIVSFDFSESFNEAIEAKVTAEQQALASKNKLEQVKYEAEQRIVQSKAEAEAIRIQAEALRGSTGLVELEAVKKWDGHLPQYMTGPVPFLNLTK